MESRARHSLTEVNEELQKAVCAICGPVRIRVRAGRGNQCWTLRVAEWEARRNKPRGRKLPRTPEQARKDVLASRYGLTVADYEAMCEGQGGACAICGRGESSDALYSMQSRAWLFRG